MVDRSMPRHLPVAMLCTSLTFLLLAAVLAAALCEASAFFWGRIKWFCRAKVRTPIENDSYDMWNGAVVSELFILLFKTTNMIRIFNSK